MLLGYRTQGFVLGGGERYFRDVTDLCARARLDKRDQDALADAGALRGLAGHRHRAQWIVAGVEAQLPLFGNEGPREASVVLPLPRQVEDTEADYARVGISLGPHPLRQLRSRLRATRCLDSRTLQNRPNGSWVRVAGLVVMRQRPSTASGVTFVSMEDEYGLINLIVWRQVAETYRQILLTSNILAVEGEWQQVDGSAHVIVRNMRDLSGLWSSLEARSRDFR